VIDGHDLDFLEEALRVADALTLPQKQTLKRKLPPSLLSTRQQEQRQHKQQDEDLPVLECRQQDISYFFRGGEVDWCCAELLRSGISAVGFDIEWRTTFETGVPPRKTALIQVCFAGSLGADGVRPCKPCSSVSTRSKSENQYGKGSSGHACALFQISACGVTPHLQRLLCTPVSWNAG
jgi:hypothetical protein